MLMMEFGKLRDVPNLVLRASVLEVQQAVRAPQFDAVASCVGHVELAMRVADKWICAALMRDCHNW